MVEKDNNRTLLKDFNMSTYSQPQPLSGCLISPITSAAVWSGIFTGFEIFIQKRPFSPQAAVELFGILYFYRVS